jgi:hypothetical protein
MRKRIMKSSVHYDIVRKEGECSIWLESSANLGAAETRTAELTSYWPGKFQIMERETHRIVRIFASPNAFDPS